MTVSSPARPANYWTRLLSAGMLMQGIILEGDSYIQPASYRQSLPK
jgi:hypothetical protein